MAGDRAGVLNDLAEWVRYWRVPDLPAEAMRARFTSHAYHRHSHDTYSFGVTEAGAQAFSCRHGSHVSATGQVMVFNPDDPHDGRSGRHGGFIYRMVHIQPDYFASLLSPDPGPVASGPVASGAVPADAVPASAEPWPLFRDPVLADPALFAAVTRLHATLSGPATALARYEALADAARLLHRHAATPARGSGAPVFRRAAGGAASRATTASGTASLATAAGGPSPRPATVSVATRIRELLHDIPLADLSADEVATVAGCSKYAAYRAFTAAYGLTPSQYQRQLRLRAARRLLATGTPAAVVAADTGFADQAHLTRWFRRCYGVTPAAYQSASSS